MTSPKGRKSPPVVVRRPPALPSAEVLDPSAAAAFVEGTQASESGIKPPGDLVDATVARPSVGEPTLPSDSSSTSAPVPRTSKASGHRGSKASKGAARGRGMVERAGGKAARRVVVYMEPLTARKLAIRALDEGTDVSALVNEAVRRLLAE